MLRESSHVPWLIFEVLQEVSPEGHSLQPMVQPHWPSHCLPIAWTLCMCSSSHRKCPPVPIFIRPLHVTVPLAPVSAASALGKVCHLPPCPCPRLPPLHPQSFVSIPALRGTAHGTSTSPCVLPLTESATSLPAGAAIVSHSATGQHVPSPLLQNWGPVALNGVI